MDRGGNVEENIIDPDTNVDRDDSNFPPSTRQRNAWEKKTLPPPFSPMKTRRY